jgi:hypothetical protein
MTAALRPLGRRLDALDIALIVVFLLGLYMGVSLQVTEKIPLTCAPSGAAGLLMLWRRRDRIQPAHLAGLLVVLALYLGSVMAAADVSFLSKRFTGLIQLTYSRVIAYARFLTLVEGERDQIATILLVFCLVIIAGCLLEAYGGLRPISDRVREMLYDPGVVYDADRRDEILYGRIRPKLFTSEPSAVTFAYTHCASVWLVVSRWRYKLAVYAGLIGLALVVLPGPTLLLMMLLSVPYLIFLAGAHPDRPQATRLIGAAALSAVVVLIAVVLGMTFFAARITEMQHGGDASFFYRFTGPMLVALDMFRHHPWAGSGLTGETYIANEVLNVYMNSASFSSAWRIPKIGDVLTNYFWLHWIYLGLVWGVAVVAGLCWWLRKLGTPSLLFCWIVWAILGQASGSYVGPKTWAVLLIAAAAAILSMREAPQASPRDARPPLFPQRLARIAL